MASSMSKKLRSEQSFNEFENKETQSQSESESRWQCNDIKTGQCELILTSNKFNYNRPIFHDKQSCENKCNLLSLLPLNLKNKIALHNIESLNTLRYVLPDLDQQRKNELKQSEERMMMQSSRPFELANKLLLWDQANEITIFLKLLNQFPDRDLINYLWDNIKEIIIRSTLPTHFISEEETDIVNLLRQMMFWAKRYDISLSGKTDWIWPVFYHNHVTLYTLMKSHPYIGFPNNFNDIIASDDNIFEIDRSLAQEYLPKKISESLNMGPNTNKKNELFYIDLKILGEILNFYVWEFESSKVLSHLLTQQINEQNVLNIVRIVKVLTVRQWWPDFLKTLDMIQLRTLSDILTSERGKEIYYSDTSTFGWDYKHYEYTPTRNLHRLITNYDKSNSNMMKHTDDIYKKKIVDLKIEIASILNQISEMKKSIFDNFKNDIRDAIDKENVDLIFYLLNENRSLVPGLIDAFSENKYFINDFDQYFLKSLIKSEIIRNENENNEDEEEEHQRLNIDSLERLRNYFNL